MTDPLIARPAITAVQSLLTRTKSKLGGVMIGDGIGLAAAAAAAVGGTLL